MKIGILTFPKSQSYGATLQMYALQRAMQRLGHGVEVIHYHNAYMRAERHTKRAGENSLRFAMRIFLRRLMHRRTYARFGCFEKKYIHAYPSRPFSNKQRLQQIGQRYDAVICGSDQVWNPAITGTDMSFFLDFCSEQTKRISYAPSFGVADLSEDMRTLMRPLLQKFDAISVREEAGKRLVESMVDAPVTTVVDPTFLADLADWTALESPHPAAVGEYILYFTIHRSKSLYNRCCALAREKGMKMVVVGGNWLEKIKNRDPMLEYAVDIGPQEWLYLMHHARYVMTNSFHGTAFSVIFQKDFYLEYPPHTSSRLEQIVEMLGMQSRVVQADKPLTDTPAPYAKAEQALTAMREQAMRFLSTALE